MKILNKCLILIVLLVILISGCEKNITAPDFQNEMTVFGFLWGERYLTEDQAIMIGYTKPIREYYEWEEAAIKDADVTLFDMTTGDTTTLVMSDNKLGYYYNESLLIQPRHTYKLTIVVDGKTVTSTTTVPPVLQINTNLKTDNVNVDTYEGLGVRYPIFVNCEDEDQVLLIDMFCNEDWEDARYVTKIFGQEKPNDEDDYSGGGNGEPRHIMGYGPLKGMEYNEANASYIIDWYSSMLVFWGSYTMMCIAPDDNYNTYYTTPEYPEFKCGVEGGIGVFGSFTGEKYEFYIQKME